MDAPPASHELTPALQELLASLADRAAADSLSVVYWSAARGIARLGAMDLVRYESGTPDSSADLSLWEEMAPMMKDTVEDVNAVVGMIRERFPSGGRPANEAASPEAKKLLRVEQALRLGADDLMRGVTALGERVRSPSVVSDRWNLLEELQSFRIRFREQLGNLVYETADMLHAVTREEVVPGLAEDVQTAAVVRATVADLRRVLAARVQKARESEEEDVQWNAQQLEKELDSFGRTPAYRWLPVADKRQVVEQRAALAQVTAAGAPSQEALVGIVEALLRVMEDEATRPQPLLEDHDRAVWAGLGVSLEQVTLIADTDPVGAARTFHEALHQAQRLYGRASSLDAFLRRARKSPVTELPASELPRVLEEFREILAGFAVI